MQNMMIITQSAAQHKSAPRKITKMRSARQYDVLMQHNNSNLSKKFNQIKHFSLSTTFKVLKEPP